MNIQHSIIAIVTFVIFLTSCATEGKPTPQGPLLTHNQIASLETDSCWNGKFVEIEGYPSFCGLMATITRGKKNKIEIYSEPDCEGIKLIDVNLMFGIGDVKLSGEKDRNFVLAEQNFNNNALILVTDDYEQLSNTRFKFSGRLIYKNNAYYMDNVSVHK